METELMTRATLAIYFGVKPRTIQRWEKLGMPTIHIGGIVRYSLPEIYKWIELNDFSKEMSK